MVGDMGAGTPRRRPARGDLCNREELAQGGVGGIIIGFTSVALNEFCFGGMMRLYEDMLIPGTGGWSI